MSARYVDMRIAAINGVLTEVSVADVSARHAPLRHRACG